MAGSPLKGYPRPIEIKDEPLSDIETEVSCKICSKPFASEMALRNHVKVFHIEVFETGDADQWTAYEEEPWTKKQRVEPTTPRPVAIKTNNRGNSLMSAAPDILSTLTAKNVSYIILKAENTEDGITDEMDDSDTKEKKAKRKDKVKPVVVRKVSNEKREKMTQPITGPFECTEPSPLGTDGECHQMFFSCCEYSSHVRSEHSRRRKTLRCQVCERLLPMPGDGISCETCGEQFPTADDLQEHMNSAHVKPKKYECCICHKKFTQQAGVQQHMRMHTGDRPYHCTFCPKSFTQKSGLEQHLRTHTKIKPYKCVICSKTFCQSVHLKQHMRTHTNVAPFQCGICEKRFKQSSHLNYHLKNHNPANLTDEQKKKYLQLVGKLSTVEIDPEQIIAEQSIQEEIQEDGSYDIDDSMVYIEVHEDEYIV